MGIPGLALYVNKLPSGKGKVWQLCDLCNTKLVIDGCGLYYYLYGSNRMNSKYGGQYHQLQEKVKEFFANLRSKKIEPYVLFDGIMEKHQKKINTLMRRKNESIQWVKQLWTKRSRRETAIPRLAQMAVVQVLQEIKVPYAVADFEADSEIAVLANELNAPVMANDSDFFIFNVNHGYIPFQNYDFSGSNVTKFSCNGFAKYLGMDVEMLPLLASLIGNDYISSEMLTPLTAHIERFDPSSPLEEKVQTIAHFLSKYKSVSEAFDAVVHFDPENSQLTEALNLSIEEYKRTQSNLIGYFHSGELSSNIRTYNDKSIPEWLIKLRREGLFAPEALRCLCNRKLFLQTQSEDISKPSAQRCVERLRWCYSALAMNYEDIGHSEREIIVTEFVREGSTLVPKEMKFRVEVPELRYTIYDASRISGDAEKNHVLSFLDCNLPFIRHLPIKHQLVVSALRYWIIHSQVEEAHLAALLVHYVGETRSSIEKKEDIQVSEQVVHGFAQWQNVLYWVQRLNLLFSSVFPPLQVAKLYDGIRVCLLYQRLKCQGIKFAESVVCDTQVNLYRQLYDAVTKDLPSECLFNQLRSRQKKESRKSGQGKQTRSKKKECLSGNKFGILRDELD